MEGPLVLMGLLILGWFIVGPIVALVKACNAITEARKTRKFVVAIDVDLQQMRRELRELRSASVVTVAAERAPAEVADPAVPGFPLAAESIAGVESAGQPAVPAAFAAPAETPVEPGSPAALPVVAPLPPSLPPPIQSERAAEPEASDPGLPVAPQPPAKPAKPPISLEQFMGVKMFAWLGGIAMFFGVILFVKYAFDTGWITPAMQVALGFVTGAGLLVGGLALHRKDAYKVLAQAFCATGVLILYGVTFAAHARYRFFDAVPTFALMVLITVAAFLIAVRLNALVVAVLGMLGGFLTPILVQTGRDNPLGLFGYIGLLVIGLLAVSRHRRWGFLVTAAAIGTVIMELLWCDKFFLAGHYYEGAKTFIPMGILVFFNALFLAASWLEKRRGETVLHAAGSALGMCAVAMVFAFSMLAFNQVCERIPLFYGFVLLENLAILALVWVQPRFIVAQAVNSLLTFLHLALWTGAHLHTHPEWLGLTLAVYLVFGAFHAVAPVLLGRRMPGAHAIVPQNIWPWSMPITLLLVLLPILNSPEPSLLVWPVVLLIDLLAIVLAVVTGAILPVLGSLVITLGLAGAWLLNTPADFNPLSPFLVIITGFAAVFALAGRWLIGKFAPVATADGDRRTPQQLMAGSLPILSGALPFALLVLATLQLPIGNPSPVFGVGLLLAVLLLGLALLNRQSVLVPTALACILAVEFVWHGRHFNHELPNIPLYWYLGFYALFLAFPFVFRKVCSASIWPWAASALAGVGHFLLIHKLVGASFVKMNGMMGLLPAAFAVPSLLALLAVARMVPVMDAEQRGKLAWFGGVALFFITLIFPIQFSNQWLTVSWAMEGALLLWLFRRVPHPGLLMTGLALLGISFVRLTLNPAVFSDYERSGSTILNWHLYVYGIVAAAQFAGARWFTDPGQHIKSFNPRGILLAFGGILLFLLMNIEIADYFTPKGSRCVAFSFGVNFARDMTYTIAWGLFSLVLLILGIWRHVSLARYAAIALLVITLLKLFFHDLASIGNIFRIGALIGVAVIAFAASFLYQQFFSRAKPS